MLFICDFGLKNNISSSIIPGQVPSTLDVAKPLSVNTLWVLQSPGVYAFFSLTESGSLTLMQINCHYFLSNKVGKLYTNFKRHYLGIFLLLALFEF